MGTVSVSWPEIHAFRLHRHHLDRPASKVQLVQVVRDACGIQSQFLSAASLALRARVRGLTRDDIERALWRGRGPRETWLRAVRDISREEAELALMRAYFRGYGPATVQDFGAWADVAVADAKAIFKRLGDEVAPLTVSGWTSAILRKDARTLRAARLTSPVIRLLPNFDSYLLWHDRKDHLVDAEHYKRVYRKAGWLSPVVLVDGRVVGVWSYERKGRRLRVRVEPFGKLPHAVREGVEAEAQEIARYFESSEEVTFAS